MWIDVEVNYIKIVKAHDTLLQVLNSKARVVMNDRDVDESLTGHKQEILDRNANNVRKESGLRIVGIDFATICISRHRPMGGANNGDNGDWQLPTFLRNKLAIVNIIAPGNKCFGYAIAAAKLDIERRQRNEPLPANRYRASTYDEYFEQYGLNLITYPVELVQVRDLEDQLQLSISIYGFLDDEGRMRYPIYVSKKNFPNKVRLLFWDDHYAWITSLEKLMFDSNKHQERKFICDRCLGHFTTNDIRNRHASLCNRADFDTKLFTLPDPGTRIKFIDIRRQLRIPFVIYADFESILPPDNNPLISTAFNKHVPCSAGIKLVSQPVALQDMKYLHHTGADSVEWLLRRLLEIKNKCLVHL